MSNPLPFSDDDLDHTVPAGERAALAQVAELLTRERPAPRAAFRAQLRARMRDLAGPGRLRARPAWLWQRVATLLICGGGLLGLLAAGVARSGPFAP